MIDQACCERRRKRERKKEEKKKKSGEKRGNGWLVRGLTSTKKKNKIGRARAPAARRAACRAASRARVEKPRAGRCAGERGCGGKWGRGAGRCAGGGVCGKCVVRTHVDVLLCCRRVRNWWNFTGLLCGSPLCQSRKIDTPKMGSLFDEDSRLTVDFPTPGPFQATNRGIIQYSF